MFNINKFLSKMMIRPEDVTPASTEDLADESEGDEVGDEVGEDS